MKVVINSCWGGFGLSDEAERRLAEALGVDPAEFYSRSDVERNNPELVRIVEEMGEAASGNHARLRVVEIPDDVQWYIHNYDGMEHVTEDHRTW